MCGRYYMDDETRREIRRLVLKLDQKICSESDQTAAVFPSQKATVITGGASARGGADDLGLSTV